MNAPAVAPCPASRAAWVRGAALGGAAWAVFLLLRPLEWASTLLTFAALVLVPLGLALRDDFTELCERARLGRPLPWLHLVSAALLLWSFTHYPGTQAALLALPWLGFTAAVALLSLANLARRGFGSLADTALDAGGLFLAVGGGWALLSRWGARPMNFGEPIVQLTGVHFHYAGFVLPLLTGLAARSPGGAAGRLTVLGVLLGVPLVAVGFTTAHLTRYVELVAALFLSSACLVVVFLQLRMATRWRGWPERLLLTASGLSLVAGMALAAAYALGTFRQAAWLTIPEMVRWHGTLNGLGFALAGLLAWHLHLWRPAEVQILLFGRQPDLAAWEKRPPWAGVEDGPGDGDRRDGYERDVGAEAPGDPETGGVHERVAAAILGYRIFPPWLVTGVLRRTPVEVGDTVGIRYHFLPGMDLFMAARVTERFDGPTGDVWRTGFTYRTLVGHAEYGEETFCVEKDLRTGRVRVALRSWSRPGTLLARLSSPWVRRQQVRASHAALRHLQHVAETSTESKNLDSRRVAL